MFLWPAIDKKCLEGGGEKLVRKYQRAISRLRPMDPRREALENTIFGSGRYCKFDEGGRIVLEGDLIAHAGIGEKARFVGLGDHFQIWAPDAHQNRADAMRKLALENLDLLEPFDETEAQAS